MYCNRLIYVCVRVNIVNNFLLKYSFVAKSFMTYFCAIKVTSWACKIAWICFQLCRCWTKKNHTFDVSRGQWHVQRLVQYGSAFNKVVLCNSALHCEVKWRQIYCAGGSIHLMLDVPSSFLVPSWCNWQEQVVHTVVYIASRRDNTAEALVTLLFHSTARLIRGPENIGKLRNSRTHESSLVRFDTFIGLPCHSSGSVAHATGLLLDFMLETELHDDL